MDTISQRDEEAAAERELRDDLDKYLRVLIEHRLPASYRLISADPATDH